jgi:Ca2+-binding RTX toxin-like protein
MLFESLENRRLMSVSLSAAGVLTVTGKNDINPVNADAINIYASGTNLKVNDNGVLSTFQLSKVKSLVVNLRAGADQLKIDPNVTLPSTIDSGSGGTTSGDNIQGGSGPDLIYVRSSFGVAKGGGGNDNLQNFGGINLLYGENGNDTLISKRTTTSDSRYEGGNGTDTIDYTMATINMVLRNGQSGEYIAGTTPPVVNGASLPDGVLTMENFYSGSGNDFVYGTAGNNIIRSGAGKDQVRAGAGNDTVNGGTGEDALYGEDGNDTFYSKDNTKDFLSGGIGTDKANKDAIDILNSVEGSF